MVEMIDQDDQNKGLKTLIVLDFDEAEKEIEDIRINPFILGFFLRMFKGRESVSFMMTTTRDSVKEDEAFEQYFSFVKIPDLNEEEAKEKLLLFEQDRLEQANAVKHPNKEKVKIESDALIRGARLAAKHRPNEPVAKNVIDWVNGIMPEKYGFETEMAVGLSESIRDLRDIFVNLVEEEEVPETVEALADQENVLELLRKHLAFQRKSDQGIRPRISDKDMVSFVERKLNIPAEDLTADEAEKILSLESNLNKKIVAQEGPIKEVAQAVKRARAELKFPDEPIGSFLFAGPSGVGKTLLAKTLAEELSYEFIDYDMSEFATEYDVSKLIGPPPGYKGIEEYKTWLTQRVNKNPNCVILFDEIEEAHPQSGRSLASNFRRWALNRQ